MATIGKLMVLWGTDVQGLTTGNNKARRSTQDAATSMQRSTEQASRGFRLLQSHVLALAGGAGLGALVKNAIASGDALGKTSDKLGIATDKLAGMRMAAELTGVASNTLDMALQRMTRRVAEAAGGTGEAKDAIKQLGLDATALARMQPDKQFAAIAEAMKGIEGQGEKVRLAFKLFDSEGVALVNTLDLGAEGLKRAQDEANLFGTALSRLDVAKLEAASDAGTRAQAAMAGVGNNLALQVAPILEVASNRMADLIKNTNGFANEIQLAMDIAVNGIGVFADGIHGVKIIWKGLEIVGNTVMYGVFKLLQSFGLAVDGVLNGIAMTTNAVIRGVNFVSGKDFPMIEMFNSSGAAAEMADVFFNRTLETVGEIRDLLMQPLPSDQFREGLKTVIEEAERNARQVAQVSQRVLGEVGLPGGAAGEGKDAALENERQRIADRLQMVRDATANEAEIEWNRYQERLSALQEADASMFEYEGERDLLKEQLHQQHKDRMAEIEKNAQDKYADIQNMSWDQQVGYLSNHMGEMTAGLVSGSRAMFNINKVAALANAAIKIPETVMDAYFVGNAIGGPPLGAAYGAVAGAAQLAKLQQIKAAQFGGGVAPSNSTTPATPVAPIQQEEQRPQQQVTLMLDSDRTRFHRDEVISMAQGLSDLYKDGGGVGGLRVAYTGGM